MEWWIAFTILLVINVIVISTYFVYKYTHDFVFRNYKLLAVADTKKTIDEQNYVIDIFNVDKFEKLWAANEGQLKWHAMDFPLEGAKFTKNLEVPGALTVRLPMERNFQQDLMITLSVKYNNITVSIDGDDEKFKVISIPDKELEKAKKVVYKKRGDKLLEQEMLNDFKESEKNFMLDYEDLIKSSGGAMVHINEHKSTSTSLRYQMVLPEEYRNKVNFDPESFKVFHIFEGYAYELETVFIGQFGDFFEYDLINLKPNTAYVGLSFNSNYNKTIRPSQTFYGVTYNEDGLSPSFNEAILASPSEDAQKHQMWTRVIAEKTMDKKYVDVHYKILAKKHFEFENKDKFIDLNQADKLISNFDWFDNVKKI